MKQRLQAAGIAAEIRSESESDKLLEFSRVNAGVRVEVPREHFEQALLIMHDWELEKDLPAVGAAASEPVHSASLAWMTPESPSAPR